MKIYQLISASLHKLAKVEYIFKFNPLLKRAIDLNIFYYQLLQ